MTQPLPGYALCQDCCRLHPLAALIQDCTEPPGLCPNWAAAHLQPHAVFRAIRWTADGGLRLREP
jgi:hypothetical protein